MAIKPNYEYYVSADSNTWELKALAPHYDI